MKKPIAGATLALSLMCSAAMAQERAGDAALGALSGAVVLGPVGAVAGAIVGYTAGPSISRSWGWRRGRTARYERKSAGYEARASARDSDLAPRNQAGAPTSPPAPSRRATSAAPPVQGLE